MQFIDHTGHIFSLPHYGTYPYGYEYEENPYTFWFTDEYNSELSVDCMYIQSIRPVLSDIDVASIEIRCEETNHFRLISPITIQEKISKGENIFEMSLDYYTDAALEYDSSFNSDFKTILKKDDLLFIKNLYKKNWFWSDETGKQYQFLDVDNIPEPDKDGNRFIERNGKRYPLISMTSNYTMIPFYVAACNVKEPGAWLTNVLIVINTLDGETYYCPITIGGVFNDEREELIVNGKNIGLNLPKDICKAFYSTNFSNDYVDLTLWNRKIKEYLLNVIVLRSERGNYRSAIDALKWFGWQDKLELSALIQTDNEIVDQYILDRFDLNYDVINEFRYFRNSTLLNLYFRGSVADPDSINEYNFDNEFYGESKPNILNLFDKIIEHRYDEEDIAFYRPFYDFTFNEIGLKLSALKYYYQKYFLPIHLSVYNSTVTFQTFANNIKFTNNVSTLITQQSLYVYDSIDVKFPEGSNFIWLSEEIRYIDIIDPEKTFTLDNSNWIEYGNDLELATKYIDHSVFEINDNCFSVPITFISEQEYKYYSCILRFYKDDQVIKNSVFSFVGRDRETTIRFIIYPAMINSNFDINFWLDSEYRIELLVNGVLFTYDFLLKVPELDIEMCKLEYKYDYNVCAQFTGFDGNLPMFNSFMYIPDLVKVSNINFINDYIQYLQNKNMYYIGEDNAVFRDNVYYYYYDNDGNKIILSSGNFVLRENKETGKFELVRRDIVDLLNSLSKEQLDKYFPDIKQYLTYDGDIYDIKNDKLRNILTEINEKLLLDIDTKKRIDIIEIPEGVTVYSSLYKNIYSLIDLYKEVLKLPKNNKFYNKIHLFEIKKQQANTEYVHVPYNAEESTNGECIELNIDGENVIKFGDNDAELVKDLYLEFFDEEGYWLKKLEYKDEKTEKWIETSLEKELYDFYLMHDNDVWYGIMISKQPISEMSDTSVNKHYRVNDNLYLQHSRSDEKFLINRMDFIDMKNVYHYNVDDMIVARLNNYKNIPFKLIAGSKWMFTPLGIGSDISETIESNTNFAIMSVTGSENDHKPGYYAVKVSYSIDNFVNHNQERTTKILIN